MIRCGVGLGERLGRSLVGVVLSLWLSPRGFCAGELMDPRFGLGLLVLEHDLFVVVVGWASRY